MTAAEKEKRKPKFLRKIFESPKKRAERLSTKSGKANTAATKKMYAAESMFNTAKARDDAKVTPGKARPFGDAKAAAEKARAEKEAAEQMLKRMGGPKLPLAKAKSKSKKRYG